MRQDPVRRPLADELLEDPWLRQGSVGQAWLRANSCVWVIAVGRCRGRRRSRARRGACCGNRKQLRGSLPSCSRCLLQVHRKLTAQTAKHQPLLPEEGARGDRSASCSHGGKVASIPRSPPDCRKLRSNLFEQLRRRFETHARPSNCSRRSPIRSKRPQAVRACAVKVGDRA